MAELALTLVLALLRRVHSFDRAAWTRHSWAPAQDAGPGQELAEPARRVVGASRTGPELIRMVRAVGGS